jgi:hypothetical protein
MALAMACANAAAASSGMIPAPGRVDVAYDSSSSTLFISGGSSLRRYDLRAGAFLPPLELGGSTFGLDISADGRTLAVANAALDGDRVVIDLVDLPTLQVRRVGLPATASENGALIAVFDKAGDLVVSTQYAGSGWTVLRRINPDTGVIRELATVSAPTMLAPSADHAYIGVASGNNSSGPFGIYTTGDNAYTPLGRIDWFVVDVGLASDGSQQAIVTSSGAYIDDRKTVLPQVGEYFGPTPIGAAYSPRGHKVYFPISQTNTVVQYDTRTMMPMRTFEVPGQFEWVGNKVFVEGRTRLSGDGALLFVTLDNGVFYTSTKDVE